MHPHDDLSRYSEIDIASTKRLYLFTTGKTEEDWSTLTEVEKARLVYFALEVGRQILEHNKTE